MAIIDNVMERLERLVDRKIEAVAPFRAIVTGVSGGMVTIKRLGVTTGETELRARVVGFDLDADDEVLCVLVNGKPVVVGEIQRNPLEQLTIGGDTVGGTESTTTTPAPAGPVTVATNARGWYDDGTSVWTARCGWDTGSAIYVALQDTGGSPKLRVYKGNAYPTPTAFSATDDGDSPSVQNGAYPFSTWLHDDSTLHAAVFTGTTGEADHVRFNVGTDQWTTDFGQIGTTLNVHRSLRLVVLPSNDDVVVAAQRESDPTDINRYVWGGASWSAATWFDITSSDNASIADLVIDSSSNAFLFFYDPASDAFRYSSRLAGGTLSSAVAIDTTAATSDAAHSAGARFTVDTTGTDTVRAAHIDSDGTLDYRTVTLEAAANSGNLGTQSQAATAGDVGTRTPISTTAGQIVWWDDANSGTIMVNGAPALTGVTRLIEAFPVSTGLAVLYQDGSDVKFAYLIAP